MKLTTDQEAVRDAYREWTESIGMRENNLQYVFTPYSLCEEMILKLKENTGLKKKNILVFNLEFAIVLMEQGVSPENITFLTDCTEKVVFAEHLGVAVMLEEFKKIIDEKRDLGKFDVVVGNPPYDSPNDESSFTNLWADFVHKAFELSSKYTVMITPKTWANQVSISNKSSKVFDLIKNHAIFVNIDECAKYFNGIGSSFSYYILDCDNRQKCKIVTPTEQLVVNWDEILFVPNDFNHLTISIIHKLLNREMFDFITSSGTVGNVSNTKTDKHIYSIRYSMGTEKWSDTPHLYQFTEKLVFPNQTAKNFPVYAPESAPANRGVFYIVRNEDEANTMLTYIKSKPIQFLIRQQRTHHGFLNTTVIQKIPKIDLSQNFTDQDLYQYFNLTQEEIDLIELKEEEKEK